jgi:hypothetical protein
VPLEEVFRSRFWVPHIKRLAVNDLIRLRSVDSSLDVMLVVQSKIGDRVVISRFPRVPNSVRDAAAAADVKQIEKTKGTAA